MLALQITLVVGFWIAVALGLYWLIRQLTQASDTRRRAFADLQEEARTAALLQSDDMNWLRRWLFLAGFRTPSAINVFLATTCGTVIVGIVATLLLFASGIYGAMLRSAAAVPGGVGEVFLPAVVVRSSTSAAENRSRRTGSASDIGVAIHHERIGAGFRGGLGPRASDATRGAAASNGTAQLSGRLARRPLADSMPAKIV
jgi:hypothetical protein